MPITETGQGEGKETRGKELHYRQILMAHMRIVGGIVRRKSASVLPHYHLWDLCAGTGWADGVHGSALIAPDCARQVGVPLRGWMFERIPEAAETLSRNLVGQYGDLHVIPGDCSDTVGSTLEEFRGVVRPGYGLVYWDPNGTVRLPITVIGRVIDMPCFGMVDVLAYMSAAAIKRCVGAGLAVDRLEDQIRQVGKRVIHIRRPIAKHQWTFVFWTNWPHPVLRNQGFRLLDSHEGQAILHELNYSTEERGEMPAPQVPQLTLF